MIYTREICLSLEINY